MRIILYIAILVVLLACSTTNEKATALVSTLPSLEDIHPYKNIWSVKVGSVKDSINGGIYLAQSTDHIYTLGKKNRLYAINKQTGEKVWQIELKDLYLTGGVGYGDGLVLLGASEGEVVAINAKDGAIQWQSILSSEILSPPQAFNGVVFVKSNDGAIYGLSAQDGRRLWAQQQRVPALTLRGTSKPLLYQNMIISAFANGSLSALDLKTGKSLWEVNINIPKGRTELERIIDIDAQLHIHNGIIYTVGYQGRAAAVDSGNGRILWAHDISSYAGLTVDAKAVYIAIDNGHVTALDRYSGAVLWKQEKLEDFKLSEPLQHDDYVIVHDEDGNFYWLNKDDGQLLAGMEISDLPSKYRMKRAGLTIKPDLTDQILYVNSQNGVLSAISTAR
jgi:outer membrane protein assembly factor BamB